MKTSTGRPPRSPLRSRHSQRAQAPAHEIRPPHCAATGLSWELSPAHQAGQLFFRGFDRRSGPWRRYLDPARSALHTPSWGGLASPSTFLTGPLFHSVSYRTAGCVEFCLRRRANWSIARSTPLQRRAVRWKIQKLSATTLTRCAATVLTSQPLHRLADANCAASSPSIKLAIRRRSSATATKTSSRSNRLWRKRAQPIGANSTCSSLSPRMMNVGS